MGDITDEENVDTPINTPPDNPSDDFVPVTGTETITENQETENMEVHHHPHVEKKNFKEYLLEGLMIFLAVTLGFFAESFRENIIEKTREKEYMKEIVANLKYDTIRCSVNAKINIEHMHGLDSLRS